MKITNEGRLAFGSLLSNLGGDPDVPEGETPVDCCDDGTDIPDRALDSTAYTVNSPASGGIVQIKPGTWHAPGSFTDSFDATPTNGNTMYAFLFQPSGAVIDTSGWTLLETGSTVSADAVGMTLWTKVAGAAEPTGVHVDASGGGTNSRRMVLYEVAGSTDVHDDLDNQSGSSPLVGPSLDATNDPSIHIVAFTGQVATYAGDPTWTPLNGLVTDSFSRQPSARPVTFTGHVDVDDNPFAASLTTTPLYAGRQTCSVAVVVDASPTATEWNVIAPNTVDGDDASYHEIDGPDVLRVDLGAAFVIVRARLLIGCEDAGHVTYTITGANDADFSDGVALGSVTFDSTGSFTADDEDILWATTTAYQYFQLSGPDENRRIFSFELYEASTSAGEDHTHADLESEIDSIAESLDEHVVDTSDAHDASAISFSPTAGIAATDVQAAIVEDAGDLAAHLADTVDAHDASAVSFAPAAGIAATDVQAAIVEDAGDLAAHLADTSDAHDASAISIVDAGNYFTGTDVEAALQELGTGGGGGAPTTADYLVGTAQGGLSAEIVVGTSPGGELGGTWASPTVDATHSGSAHHNENHASRHADAGSDALDVTTLDGFPGGTSTYLRADGSFSTPSGTGVGAEDEQLVVAMEVFL